MFLYEICREIFYCGKTFDCTLLKCIKTLLFIFRLKKFGIPCPHVQVLKKHVLVMSFIGKDTQSAPKLKEVKLSTEDMQDAFEQTIDVRFIYRK